MNRFKNNESRIEGRNQALEYLKNAQEGDLSPLKKLGFQYLSWIIDGAAQRVFDDLSGKLDRSKIHQKRVAILLAHEPKWADSDRKNILENSSSFEQMVALKGASSGFEGKRRFQFVTNEDDYVPVKASGSDLFQTVLGDTRGKHKAPKYSEWTGEFSQSIADQLKLFLLPLEALEMVRQPDFNGATLIKGNAYDAELIDGEWRFGKDYACVEEKQQRRKNQLGHSSRKLQSAGLNFVGLAKELNSPTKSICPVVRYEDYADEGYKDDLIVAVSIKELTKAIQQEIVGDNREPLDELMRRLFMTKIGPQQTRCLRDPVAQKIFHEPRTI